MSEVNEELNEQMEEEMDDASVITVPIDDTLSNSGEAADAKAVGDALALKADRSEIQTAIKVNGQSADNEGQILVYANQINMSDELDAKTVAETIEEVDEKVDDLTGEDIDLDATPAHGTVAEAIADLAADFSDADIQEILVAAGYEEADA